MSYDSKLESVKQAINSHNENVDEKNQINWDVFLESLQNDLGGTSEEVVSQASWEDLQEIECRINHPTSKKLPKLMAKTISKTFRERSTNGSKSNYITKRKAQELTTKELLERYNPREVESEVYKRLYSISRGKKVLAYDSDGNILVDLSIRAINDIEEGYAELDHVLDNNNLPVPLYKVGYTKPKMVNQNPFYPSTVLRNGDVCEKLNVSWSEVDHDTRSLVYLAIHKTGEADISSRDNAFNLFSLVTGDNAVVKLGQRYPKAYRKFATLKEQNDLPSLKKELNRKNSSNDPFDGEVSYREVRSR